MNAVTIPEIIARWPSRKVLAEDMGVDIFVVHKWAGRGSIPARYDARLIDAASCRNIPLNWREIMDARAHADQHGHSASQVKFGGDENSRAVNGGAA